MDRQEREDERHKMFLELGIIFKDGTYDLKGAVGAPIKDYRPTSNRSLTELMLFHEWLVFYGMDSYRFSYDAIYKLFIKFSKGKYNRWSARNIAKTYWRITQVKP